MSEALLQNCPLDGEAYRPSRYDHHVELASADASARRYSKSTQLVDPAGDIRIAMAGVQDPQVVDLVTLDADAGGCVLVAVEERPWTAGSNVAQLHKKMEYYLSFILDGELGTKFPEAKGKPVRIRLECAFQPPLDVRNFLQRLSEALRSHGVDFEVRVWPDNAAQPS